MAIASPLFNKQNRARQSQGHTKQRTKRQKRTAIHPSQTHRGEARAHNVAPSSAHGGPPTPGPTHPSDIPKQRTSSCPGRETKREQETDPGQQVAPTPIPSVRPIPLGPITTPPANRSPRQPTYSAHQQQYGDPTRKTAIHHPTHRNRTDDHPTHHPRRPTHQISRKMRRKPGQEARRVSRRPTVRALCANVWPAAPRPIPSSANPPTAPLSRGKHPPKRARWRDLTRNQSGIPRSTRAQERPNSASA